MTPLGRDTYVFIVRLWREPREIASAQPMWRGTVEHVPTGERCSVRRVQDVSTLIAERLGETSPNRPWWRFGWLMWRSAPGSGWSQGG